MPEVKLRVDVQSMTKLCLNIGYDDDNIAKMLSEQYGLERQDAMAMIAELRPDAAL